MNPLQWSILLTMACLWAFSFTAIEIGLTELNPVSLMFWRLVPAAALCLLVVRILGLKHPGFANRNYWILCLITGGLSTALPFALLAVGQQYITGSLSSVLNSTVPIPAAILAHFLLKDERLTSLKITGLILGISGILIIFGIDSLRNFDLSSFGQLMIITATICYAFAIIYGKRVIAAANELPDKVHPLIICSSCTACGALWVTLMMFLFDGNLGMPQTLYVWTPVMIMSLLGTGVTYMLYYYLLSQVEAVKVAMVTFIIPPVAIFMGWAILGEVLAPSIYLGMLVIFLGLLCLDGRIKQIFALMQTLATRTR